MRLLDQGLLRAGLYGYNGTLVRSPPSRSCLAAFRLITLQVGIGLSTFLYPPWWPPTIIVVVLGAAASIVRCFVCRLLGVAVPTPFAPPQFIGVGMSKVMRPGLPGLTWSFNISTIVFLSAMLSSSYIPANPNLISPHLPGQIMSVGGPLDFTQFMHGVLKGVSQVCGRCSERE
jgi:urea transporter